MISDYTYLYKSSCELDALGSEQYDVFLSAYTKAKRVKSVFERVGAKTKYWFLLPEYHFSETDLSEIKLSAETVSIEAKNRGVKELRDFVERYISNKGSELRICIDSTGFIRPTLLFLMRLLHWCNVKKYDMLYSEPKYYKHREETTFSSKYVSIEPIYGFGGNHIINSRQGDDLLIIGAGYEESLVLSVSAYKESFKKVLIYGFPPLQADMYQENRLKISESIEKYDEFLVSASDPFATAQSLRNIVQKHKEKNENRDFNLDLSPLSTKAQTIGFGLYYITERLNSATNIIFPFAEKYSQETSEGIGRIWKYSIEIE
jgi:hypothetical protein